MDVDNQDWQRVAEHTRRRTQTNLERARQITARAAEALARIQAERAAREPSLPQPAAPEPVHQAPPAPATPATRLEVYQDGALAATFEYGREAVYHGEPGRRVRALVERPHESYNPWRDEIGDGARHPDDPTWWASHIAGAGLGKAGFEIYGTNLP